MDETQALGNDGIRGTLAGRYELRGMLGKGGMADVALAYDAQLDREVAVKILHARYAEDPSFLARFRREAQAAASLTHPNIVAVYDAGDQEARPFIVMEWVRGQSLSDLLKVEKVAPARALEMVAEAALGLHYAHERGLVHRDIKPGNILLSNDGQVKVTDFGIARAINAENVTQTATVFGTAAYVAPEQAQGQEVDRRTDVYALGCVLYELLTSRAPFEADTAVALAYKHVSELPPPPSELNSSLDASLDAVVMKAMAKNPDDRYESAREMHDDLRRAAAGMPVLAPSAGSWAATQAMSEDQTAVLAPTDEPFLDDDYPADERSGRGLWLVLLGIVVLGIFALAGVLLASLLGDSAVEAAVPDVVGMELADAQQALRDEGFVPVVSDEDVQSSAVEPGQIERTDPEPGSLADEGSEVVLFVNDGPPTVDVPDLAGMVEREAQAELIELNLGIGIRQEEHSDEVDEGLVIRTDPEAGTEVPEGQEISLVVSLGPESVQLPDVEGEEEGTARNDLEGLCDPRPCLDVDVSYQESDEVDEGLVISQSPAPGAEVRIGTTVSLVVSEGVPTVVLPDVENQEEATAVQRLQQACDPEPCVVVEIEREFSDTVGANRVIVQDPGPNSEVERGSTVNLVVSNGPEPEEEPEDEPEDEEPEDEPDSDDEDDDPEA